MTLGHGFDASLATQIRFRMFLGLAREWLHGPLMLASDWLGKNLNKTVRLAPGANFKLLLGSTL